MLETDTEQITWDGRQQEATMNYLVTSITFPRPLLIHSLQTQTQEVNIYLSFNEARYRA